MISFAWKQTAPTIFNRAINDLFGVFAVLNHARETF
jgi:hypothetical protein